MLPPDAGLPVHASMESTMVDLRLMLEKTSLSGDNADRLRNVKLLFTFVDQLGGEKPQYLTKEIIDELRERLGKEGSPIKVREEKFVDKIDISPKEIRKVPFLS